MSFRPVVLLALLLAGCATEDQVKKLEERIATMEKKVDELDKKGPAARSAGAPTQAPPAGNPEEEAAAGKLVEDMQAAMAAGKVDEAKAKADELNSKYAGTTTAMRAKKMTAELAVIGKAAPPQLNVEKWFQGEGKVDLASNKPTLVVFWEVWCPHCKRSLPALELQWRRWRDQGVGVVALTRLTKSATEEGVREFLAAEHISYPIGQEDGEYAKLFSVSGIPAAAVIRDGVVVWRGHPNMLTDEIVLGVAP